VVSSLLAKYLGDYVEGLQSENLRISLLSGQVSLRNLQLKTKILDDLNLPVTVKSGMCCQQLQLIKR
jgi:vacuolar protein sorting-associated protein 13A/C